MNPPATMEIESQPFLPPAADDKQQPNICPECHIGCHSRFSTGKLILWVGTAILFNAIALMFIAVRSDKGIPAAAYAATRHEGISGIQLRYFIKSTDYVQTPYFGEPGETTDAAWDELLGDMFIRATSEELAAANQSSITLPGGSENLAWLGVSHDLHCINSIRQSIYRDHYYPNVTAKEANKLRSHSDHCLNMLRQTIQCHADTYLMTFHWTETEPKPMFSPRIPVRTCVDFNHLQESLRPRAVAMEEVKRLKNPILKKEVTSNVDI